MFGTQYSWWLRQIWTHRCSPPALNWPKLIEGSFKWSKLPLEASQPWPRCSRFRVERQVAFKVIFWPVGFVVVVVIVGPVMTRSVVRVPLLIIVVGVIVSRVLLVVGVILVGDSLFELGLSSVKISGCILGKCFCRSVELVAVKNLGGFRITNTATHTTMTTVMQRKPRHLVLVQNGSCL